VHGTSGWAVRVKIALYGASGMVGSRIAAEAVTRDHRVTGITRSEHPKLPAGVTHRQGNADDADDVARVASEHDVVISAISPSRTGGRHEPYLEAIAVLAENVGTRRLIVVGGAGSLQVAPGLRLMDTAAYPVALLPEARTQAATLELLRDVGGLVDWVYVSPPLNVAPGERTGHYRVGGDSPVGETISAEDLAVAIIDEVEKPRYRRTRFTLAH
jgi:putative NADH-flavin reductase